MRKPNVLTYLLISLVLGALLLNVAFLPRAKADGNQNYRFTMTDTATVWVSGSTASDSQITSDWQNLMQNEAVSSFASEMVQHGYYYQMGSVDTSVTVTKEPYYVGGWFFGYNGHYEAQLSSTTIINYVSNSQVPDGYNVPLGNFKMTSATTEKSHVKPIISDPDAEGEGVLLNVIETIYDWFAAQNPVIFAKTLFNFAVLVIVAVGLFELLNVVVNVGQKIVNTYNPSNLLSPINIVIYIIVALVVLMFVIPFLASRVGSGSKRKSK